MSETTATTTDQQFDPRDYGRWENLPHMHRHEFQPAGEKIGPARHDYDGFVKKTVIEGPDEAQEYHRYGCMIDNYNQIMLSRNFPAAGSPHIQDKYERLSEDTLVRVGGEIYRGYQDDKTGLIVRDSTVHYSGWGLGRKSSKPAFRFEIAPEGESDTAHKAMRRFLLVEFGLEELNQFDKIHSQYYDTDGKKKVTGGNEGSTRIPAGIAMDFYRNGNKYYITAGVSVKDGYNDDLGIRGAIVELSPSKIKMFEDILQRGADELQLVRDLNIEELRQGTEQRFAFNERLERKRRAELREIAQRLAQEYEASDSSNLTDEEVAASTKEFIEQRIEHARTYRPATYHSLPATQKIRERYSGNEIFKMYSYGRDPELAAHNMARHDAIIITALLKEQGVEGFGIDIEALKRIEKQQEIAQSIEIAKKVLELEGIHPEDGSGKYQPGSRTYATDFDSTPGSILTNGRNQAHWYVVDKNGKVKKNITTATVPSSWSEKLGEHVFAEKHQERAAELLKRLADKQGEREYESRDGPRRRKSNIAWAENILAEYTN